jgi:outer membrane protein assembly factor BamB
MVVTWMASLKEEGAGRNALVDNVLVAFNAETGELLWSHILPSQNDINPNTPIYIDGMILSVTGYRGGAWLHRLVDGGKNAELVWKNEEMDNQMGGGAIKIGDYLYAGGHQNNNWFCVDWKTGETKYKTSDIGRSNIIFADGMLYSYSEKGEMFLVKPNPEQLEIVSSFKITLGTDQHWAHPVIHQGILYVRHGDALMAYKIK